MTTPHHPKKPAQQDWHRADIVAELRKAGWSIRRLSTHHGYAAPTTLTNALARPWPKGERLIAEAIGVHPATIWPSRYTADGQPARDRIPKNTKSGASASRIEGRRSVA